MKVLVATSDVPFVEGGHRVIARALVQALQQAGHEAELFTTPTNRFGRQFAAYFATRLTDVEKTGNDEHVDRLISLRFPSYALKHPQHVCWLIHRMREYYDLWPQWSQTLSWKGKVKEGIRKKFIHIADDYLLKHNVKKLFALSKNVQTQLLKWGNLRSEVLYPPPPGNGYYTERYDGFILSPARLTRLKRIPLLLQSLQLCKSARAILTGTGNDQEFIQSWIRENKMEDRIRCVGHVPFEELRRLYAECRAIYYAPVNEDFGMVTMEAFRSRKPVITTNDSGGTAEVVRDGVTGFISGPQPEAIAANISILMEDPALAEKMGSAGYEEWKDLTWPNTVSKLLSL